MRRLSILIAFGLAAVAAAGWTWGWYEHLKSQELTFAHQRLTLLEAENTRLSSVLATRQKAQDTGAERDLRTNIERRVTDLRGMTFLRPVQYREIPREDLPRILSEKLAQQIPDQEFDHTGIALAALGLLPTGTDLKKTYLELLGEQIGAFYDQHTAELYTFSGHPLTNSQNRVILAHELTHALEDQRFGLTRLPLEAKGNDDRALAASALVEGDATLVMNRYMLGDLSAATLQESLAGALSTDVRKLAAAPRYLRAMLLFPYLRGQEFCAALYERGGWQGLAEAFAHPPTSSSQILHPDRYAANPTAVPPPVDLGAESVLGLQPIDDNVLGEFGIAQLLTRSLGDESTANEMAARWQTDRFRVYGDAHANSYIWKTGWATQADAIRFFERLTDVLLVRYASEKITKTHQPVDAADSVRAVFTLAAPSQREVVLQQYDSWVTLIDAQDPTWASALQRSNAEGRPSER